MVFRALHKEFLQNGIADVQRCCQGNSRGLFWGPGDFAKWLKLPNQGQEVLDIIGYFFLLFLSKISQAGEGNLLLFSGDLCPELS